MSLYFMLYTKYNKNYTILYIAIHIILGIILSLDKIPAHYRFFLLTIKIVYQLGQLAINKRYFFWTNRLKNGNSISHTVNKLLHHYLGYIIAVFLIV